MKISPLSFAARLTHEQREELFAMLQTKTFAEGVAWCQELGVKTSDSSLSEWFRRYRMIRKVEGYDQAADELADRLAKRGIDPVLAPKLAQQAFLLQAAEAEDADTFLAMAGLIQRHVEFEASKKEHDDKMTVKGKELAQRDKTIQQKDKVIEMQRRKIEALEAQAEAAKKAAERTKAALNSGGMDEETRKALVEEMDALLLGVKKPTKPSAT